MVLHSFRYLLLLLFFVLVPAVIGIDESLAEENPKSLITRGGELSEKGQHEQAIQIFQKAVQMDPVSEEAYLGLGNSHYELESFEAATDAFRHVLKINPNNSTAHFYLGLSLIQQKKYAESIPNFKKAGTLDSDFKQLSLFYIGEAQSELGKLQEASETWRQTIEINPSTDIARKTGILVKKLTQKKSEKPWSVSLRAGIEYDDNVTVSLQDLASGVDDYSSVFEFSGDYKFLKTKKFELQAGYDFYQSLYHELTEFNLQSHIFSLGGGYKINGVNTDVFTSYNRTTLGGEDFLESYSVAPQIGFFPSEKWYALIGYSYEDFEFFTDRSRDGESHSFGLDNFIFFMGGKSYILIGYRFEDRKTRDDQFTYEGHFATLGIKTPLPIFDRKGSFNLSYRYFYKDYTNVTPSLNQERRDFRHTIHVGLSQPLCEWLALNLSYEFIDSVSNLRAIDFTENVASLSLSITF